MKTNKTFYIENLGCAKNQVDAESLIAQFQDAGWVYVEDPEQAGLILVNTCGFIRSAKEESVNTLIDFKGNYPTARVIATGCLSQRYGDKFLKLLPEIDGFVGNRSLVEIPRQVEALIEQGEKIAFSSFEGAKKGVEKDLLSPNLLFREKLLNLDGFAYVKIAEGCNHCCSYCAIPLIRGGVESRSFRDIVAEIDALVDSGVYEINLVAQDLFAYGQDWEVSPSGELYFIELLRAIFQLDKNFVVRLLYMHPDMFDFALLDLMKCEKRLLPYLDLPFQHSATSILRSMGRRGDSESYLKLIKEIREVVPHVVIRSTFLLGYPGETRDDFENLYHFISEAHLDWAGFFVYSREEGTPAYAMTNWFRNRRTVARAKKNQLALQQIQQAITEKTLVRYLGKEFDVLVEERVEGESLYLGRCWFQAPEVDGLTVIEANDLTLGQVVRCKVVRCNGIDLEAVVVR